MPALSRPAVNPRWQFHAFWLVLLPLPPLGVSAGTVQWLVLGDSSHQSLTGRPQPAL